MPFACPSVTLTVPSHIPPRITGGIRPTPKEGLKKPVKIRPSPLSKRWMKIANGRPAGKKKAVTASRLLDAREAWANPAPDALQKNFKNGSGKSNSAKSSRGKRNFSKEKSQSSGQFLGHSKGMNACKGKGTFQGTKGGQGKGSSGQRYPHSGRGASLHQVAGSDENHYNNMTMEGDYAPDEGGNLGEEGPG